MGLVGSAGLNAIAQPNSKPGSELKTKLTQAIKTAYPDAVIKGMGSETEDGVSFYEVKFTSKGKKIEADVTADGTLLETEEAADIGTFPEPAAKAIKAAATGAKIGGTEINRKFAKAEKDATSGAVKVTKLAEPIVAYKADLKKGGMKGEIGVSADGTVLESPNWAKSESKKEKD